MQTVHLALVGLGNLGRRFCEILIDKKEWLEARYGLAFVLVGAADSRGFAYDPEGLDLATVVALKREGDTVAAYPDVGRADQEALDMVQLAAADVLLEASPVNLSEQAEPGLSCVLTALRRGMHVVTPNKGPLVVAYQEVQELVAAQGVELRFDGAVAGGLPALNIGQRDMRGAVIQAVEAVPNLVTGYVMDMLADGITWDAALERAREEGVLEADSAWDLEGWDAAAKLAILANAVLDEPAQLVDVVRAGITDLDPAMLVTAREQGKRYRLLARAERQVDGGYELSVAPVPLPPTHPLAGLGSKQMGICYFTDIYGTLTVIIDEPTPMPSAATMLRDLLDIFVV